MLMWGTNVICDVLRSHIVDDGHSNKHRIKYRGVIHATVSIAREEGLPGLYRVSFYYHTVWYACKSKS